MKKYAIISCAVLLLHVMGLAQTGPGGIGATDGSSTLELWLKADTGVEEATSDEAEVGDNVQNWLDQSGNANDMQNDYGSNPTFNTNGSGKYLIDFSGGSKYLRGNSVFSGTGARTMFVVARPSSLSSSGANNCAAAMAPNQAAGKGYGLFFEAPAGSTGMGLRVSGNKLMDYTTSTTQPTIISCQSGASANVTATNFYANGDLLSTVAAQNGNTLNTSSLGVIIGGFSSNGDNVPESTYDFNGDVHEIIFFSEDLNMARRKIIENYLAAKYNIDIADSSDFFAYETTHATDLVGIGREDASNQHTTSESASILQVSNASDLDNDEYLLFGHDNGSIASWTATGAPSTGNIQMLSRAWRFDETGDVGTVTVDIDTTAFPAKPTGYLKYLLLVDADGDFSSGATYHTLTLSGGKYQVTGIDFNAGDYVTIAVMKPVLQFSATSSSGSEATSPVTLQVDLNYPLPNNVSFDFQIDGASTATEGGGNDFTISNGPITLLAGNTDTTITLTINGDSDIEDDETIIVDLQSPSGVSFGADSVYTYTIHDDDNSRKIDFVSTGSSGAEDETSVSIMVQINAVDMSNPTWVQYTIGGTATNGAVDFNLPTDTAIITAGNTQDTIDITINDDVLNEGDETIILTLYNPNNANIGTNTTYTYTITDNEVEPTVQFSSTTSSASENAGTANVEVSLSNTSGQDVTVDYAVTGGTATGSGTDYTLSSGTLTISSGNSANNIVISIVNDSDIEGGETVTIELSNPTGATLGADSVNTFTISDDDNEGYVGPGGVGDQNNNVLWLRAADIGISDGSAVDAWVDTSGNDNDFSASGGARPTYNTGIINNNPVVRFDGTNDIMTGPSIVSGSTARSVFMVLKTTTKPGTYGGCLMNFNYPQTHTSGAEYSITPELAIRVNGNRVFNEGTGTSNFHIVGLRQGSGVNVTEIEMSLDGTDATEASSSSATINTGTNGSSLGHSDHVTDYMDGDMAEVIVYNTELNAAQRIIVENYLSTKYDITVPNDRFVHDGSHPYDVAGIGSEGAGNKHTVARSGGILGIGSPTSLDSTDYLLFGHNGGAVSSWVTTEAPNSGAEIKRVAREWRIDETGDVGTVTISIDTSLLPARPAGYSSFYIMVDGNGDFSSGATLYPMVSAGGSEFEATGVEITDNDYISVAVVEPVIQFTSTTASATEPNNPGTFSINLNYKQLTDVTVDYTVTGGTATGGGDDYTLADGTATITAGNTSISKNITIINDAELESDETIIIQLSNPSTGINMGEDSVMTFTITDDDNNRKVQFSSASSNGDESTNSVQLTVEVNNPDAFNPITFDYAVTGGTATGGGVDYTLASGTDTIAIDSSQVTFNFFVNEDALDEADETIIITLSNPTNANLGDTVSHTYTIQDNDDAPTVQFTSTSSSGPEGTTPANIEVSLSAISGQEVTVDYSVTGGTASGGGVDYSLSSGTLTITAGNSTANIQPVITDDSEIEGGETIIIDLSNATGAVLGADSVNTFTISDNDNDGYTGPAGVGDENNNVLWLRAGDIAQSDSTVVTTWTDESGNSNDFSGSGTTRPLYRTSVVNGRPVVRFDGSDDLLTGPSLLSGTTGRTLFIISKLAIDGGSYGGVLMSLDYPSTSGTGKTFTVTPEAAVRVNGNRIWNEGLGTSAFRLLTLRNADGADVNEIDMFLDGTAGTESSSSAATLNTGTGGSSLGYSDHLGEYLDGDIAEVIVYNTELNEAQRIIIENSLGAKYGLAVANDKYAYESSHSYDVAGIGRIDSSAKHTAAQSAGILSVSSASGLDDGEYLLFGHQGGSIDSWTTTEIPSTGTDIQRLAREWRLDETGDLGTVTVSIDSSLLPARPAGYSTYYILLDGDGDFRYSASTYKMTPVGGSNYEVSGLDISDGDYVAIAAVKPVIQFSDSVASEFEPDGPGVVGLTLNYALGTDVTVDYEVTGGTATGGGEDYVFSNGTATITSGNTSTNLNITLVNDTALEAAETILLKLSNPSTGINLGEDSTLTFFINDDDNLRKIEFQTTSGSGSESVTSVPVTIRINTTSASSTTVDYAVTGGTATGSGTDYTLASGTATVDPGDTTTTINISISNDALDEDDETIVITLTDPTNANLDDNTTFTYTIQDDDDAPTIAFTNATSSGPEGDSDQSIEVSLSAVSSNLISVDYAVTGGTATGGGTDYSFSSGTLNIPAGSTTGTIDLTVVEDAEIESGETIIFQISNPTNATLGADSLHTFTINDNDNNGYTGPGGVGNSNNNVLWLRADDINLTGGSMVTTWPDTSGNGNNFSGSGSSRPTFETSVINWLPVVRFDGTEDMLTGPTVVSGSSGRTIFVISKMSVDGGTYGGTIMSLDHPTGGGSGEAFTVTPEVAVRVNGNRVFNQGLGTSDFRLLTLRNADGANITSMEMFLDGAAGSETSSGSASINTGTGGSALGYCDHISEYFEGDIAEVIVYNTELSEPQRKIVENYLAAKYAISINNDDYAYQATHGYDVAGIGSEGLSGIHTKASSAGILTISNATSLDSTDYLFFGHDNGSIGSWTTTETPLSELERTAREWRVDETGNLGQISVTLDTTLLPARSAGFNGCVLLVDGDGDFSSGAAIFNMTYDGGSTYTAANVDVADGNYITFASARNISKTNGDFNDINVWHSGSVPGTGETAIINGNTVTLTDDQTIGSIEILSGSTLDLDSYTLNVDNGTIANSGTFTASTGTVNYSKADNQDVADLSYYNLTLSGSGTKLLQGDITIDNDLTISSGTFDVDVANDYNITINGDWFNSGGTFEARNGTVKFTGVSDQVITSNDQSFYDVQINNSATEITLNDNFDISNSLTLTDGVVTTGTDTVKLDNSTAASLSGYSSASFINGNLVRYMASNTSTYGFPVGNGTAGTNYYLAEVINDNLAGISYIQSSFSPLQNHDDNDMNCSDTSQTYNTINTAGVWILEPNSQPSGGQYDIKIYTANMTGLEDNKFGVLKRPVGSTSGADWTTGGGYLNPPNGAGRLVSDGYMLRMGLTSFSEFGGGGGDGGGSGLPIELLSFTAQPEGNAVKIDWVTATEINNDFFTVEKSKDGLEFDTLAVFEGAGNSSVINTYSTYDRNPYEGISYYRLKQTDFDGAYSYSHIVSVNMLADDNQVAVEVFPNPLSASNPSLTILYNMDTEQKLSINLIDISGKTILTQDHVASSNEVISLDLPESIPSGVYFLNIYSETFRHSEKVIVN